MKQPWPKQIFVSGTGTGVGKTVASAILVEALQADYWKPVQCGGLDNSDSMVVRSLISNTQSVIHPEGYALKLPASPHYAAAHEGIEINTTKLVPPKTTRPLIIEGAGGLMVPLNKWKLVIDFIQQLNVPVLLVSKNYLGGINHALLSTDVLRSRNIPLAGILFNGDNFFDNEKNIQHFSEANIVGHIDETTTIDKAFVSAQAEKLRQSLSNYFSW